MFVMKISETLRGIIHNFYTLIFIYYPRVIHQINSSTSLINLGHVEPEAKHDAKAGTASTSEQAAKEGMASTSKQADSTGNQLAKEKHRKKKHHKKRE